MAGDQVMRFQLLRRAKKGFTLVELLVVTGITGLLLLTVSAMFMTVLVGRAQSSLRDQVHTEGNEIMGRIEFIVRNSVEVVDCGGTPIFKTINDQYVSFAPGSVLSPPTDDLLMRSPQPPVPPSTSFTTNPALDEVLNSDSVLLDGSASVLNGFEISCTEAGSTNKKSVSIKLRLQHADTTDTTVSEEFSSIVQLRNS